MTDETLKTLYRNMYKGMLNKDIELLSRIITPDFHLIHMTGVDQTRDEWFNDIKTGRMSYLASKEHAIKNLTISNESASFIGQNHVNAVIYGSKGNWPLQLKMLLRKEGGEWLISKAIASTF